MRKALTMMLASVVLLALPSSAMASIADLSIDASDSPDPVALGSDLTYTYVVTNNGPDSAGSLPFNTLTPGATTFQSFAAPAGWSIANVPGPGGTGSVQATSPSLGHGGIALITFVVKTSAPGTLANTATVTSPTDLAPANNSVTTLTTVSGAPVAPAARKRCKKHRHKAAASKKKHCKKKKR